MLEASDFDEVFITKIENKYGVTIAWRCTIKKNFSFQEHVAVTSVAKTRKDALAKAKHVVEGASENHYSF